MATSYYPGDTITTNDGGHFLILNIEGNFITAKRKSGIPFTLSIYNFIKKHKKEFADQKIGSRNLKEKRLKELVEIEKNKPQTPIPAEKIYWSYSEAKKWAIENLVPLGINSSSRWQAYYSGRYPNAPDFPAMIPKMLAKYYSDCGWSSWKEFFMEEILTSVDVKQKKSKEKRYYLRYGRSDGRNASQEHELIHF